MRIMHDKNYIVEFNMIHTSTWCSKNEELPSEIYVLFDNVTVGEYLLDGADIEKRQKAVANIDSICEKLLVDGYCRASDFENFKWYDQYENLAI